MIGWSAAIAQNLIADAIWTAVVIGGWRWWRRRGAPFVDSWWGALTILPPLRWIRHGWGWCWWRVQP